MPLAYLRVLGLRGFGESQELPIAMPTGVRGSGLTVIVGPNSAGKSTLVEALQLFPQSNPPSLPEGKRNRRADSRVHLMLGDEVGATIELTTVPEGGSETFRTDAGTEWVRRMMVLPSRRYFEPFFSRATADRKNYIVHSLSLIHI